MTQSGNGKREYNPEVEYERVVDDSDVFYKVNPETGDREDVVTAKDVMDEIDKALSEQDEEPEDPA
ncbi:hypothetical protein [Nostoc sp. 'Lobaria pulmonaria (5183) cyanobiont']|uniref:hypothetical protein n=1 Tax=Nostoc sp. 'Lobaria pulmonaria (5183) cyanobiont' TaxID=1618022 RepID=UPI000CF30FD8|nr:hypothetical protein [Nostoc sp. 'Lobaria pulmonaria (5183) cyanobiont']